VLARLRIAAIGGGPAGLYSGILLRKAFPDCAVRIFERNRAGDTFGFGVVFSDETLSFLDEADPESAAEIRRRFRMWQKIETHFRGRTVVSTGHGFSAIERAELLSILARRAVELGCELSYERELAPGEALPPADLVIACDGVNSALRDRFAASFRPGVELGECRFTWLGTDLPLDAFTFWFVETPHGLFRIHAYPYREGRSTFIVETTEETYCAAGFENASEDATAAACERLFAEVLGSHRLFVNRSIWRRFPTVTCESWRHENVVLLGDAAHTAHFSIGSGTKLAMEDAIELVATLQTAGARDIPAALAAYENRRRLDVLKLQRAAKVSRRWFEETERWRAQEPVIFAFNLMTRSKRITYDNLRERDPELVGEVDRQFRRDSLGESPPDDDRKISPPMFTPYRARSIELSNRVVVSPMCQYSAVDGIPGDWHLVHLGGRAMGGAALVFGEMTDVLPEGRITPRCTGIWNEAQTAAWRRIVEWVHAETPAKIGLQIAHAGRKGSVHHPWEGEDLPLPEGEAWETIGPSAVPYRPGWRTPRAMDRTDMNLVREAFAAAARRAAAAGFDWLEIHAAHGYLLSSFLSPLANLRDDDHGGSIENRMRYPLEVFAAVREAWPRHLPMSVRISATDWMEEEGRGMTVGDSVAFARELKARGCDLVDVSSAGNSPESRPEFGRMYQTPFADRIRHEAGIPVIAVGGIMDADHANTVLAAGRADLVAIARSHLSDPYLVRRAAARYGVDIDWPGQYWLARPRPAKI
jgi:anthraniloyl-CoA monooxygenase